MLLASVESNTRNGSVVAGSKEGSTSKGILPQCVQSWYIPVVRTEEKEHE